MSPALAFYGNWGPVAATVGSPTPLVFLLAALVIAPTALSYAFVSNRLPSAGGAYTFIGRGLNRHLGNWSGFAVVSFYILILFTPSTLFGLFFNAFLQRHRAERQPDQLLDLRAGRDLVLRGRRDAGLPRDPVVVPGGHHHRERSRSW